MREEEEEEALTSSRLPEMERAVEVNLTGIAELGWRWGLWVDLAPSSSAAAEFVRRRSDPGLPAGIAPRSRPGWAETNEASRE